MKKVLTLLLAASLIIPGCKKDNHDPEAPVIEFGGFNYLGTNAQGKDSLVEMIIKFKDVNGDIGTQDGEKTATCGYKYPDLFMFYEVYSNGSYIPDIINPVFPDTVWDSQCNVVEVRDTFQNEITFSVPYIEPEGNNKSIEGEISYLMELRSALYLSVKENGRFRVYLRDRAGNKSNEILTDPLIIKI